MFVYLFSRKVRVSDEMMDLQEALLAFAAGR